MASRDELLKESGRRLHSITATVAFHFAPELLGPGRRIDRGRPTGWAKLSLFPSADVGELKALHGSSGYHCDGAREHANQSGVLEAARAKRGNASSVVGRNEKCVR